jgi:aspartyl-tRNA(Asn)/glutamyl-tRNA(Gln) amidotransferase subunit B
VELKNINSFRFVQKAIDHEAARQEAVLESGGRIVQETRGWDEKKGETFSMRSKEEAQDYRYFPEPDLPPLVLEDAWIAEVRAGMPELPREKRARFVKEYELSPYAAEVLTQHPRIAAFFEETVMLNGQAGRAVAVANFIQSEVLRDVTTHGLEAELPVSPRQVAELMKLVHAGTISGKQAKDVYARVAKDGTMPAAVVAELGLAQVSDAGAIEEACRRVILANPKQAESFKAGKTALLGYLVGQVMKETKGSANPALVNDTLKRLLAP